jgi:hypothetical protein
VDHTTHLPTNEHRSRKILQGILTSYPIILLFLIANCKESAVAPHPQAGENTLQVFAEAYDEFNRHVPLHGSVSVSLIATDRNWTVTIPEGDSSYTFLGLPPQKYIVHAEKEGFYPYEATAGTFITWQVPLNLYPLPSPEFRIDSIQCFPNLAGNQVSIKLVTCKPVPATGRGDAAVFFALDANVGPLPGSYYKESLAYTFSGSNTTTSSLLPWAFNVPLGTRIYVTARLLTGATKVFYKDSLFGLRIYTNLEQNTNIVTSFVLQ